MLNIVFDELTAGGLRLAKDPETSSYICNEDIVRLVWMLDIGYLKEGISSEYRQKLPGRLCLQDSFLLTEEEKDEIRSTGEKSLREWERLIDRVRKKEPVRIWYSDAPHSLCGMFHVCTLLKDYDSQVFSLCAPKSTPGEDTWYLGGTWGAHSSESLTESITAARLMEKGEIRAYAEHWSMLEQENAPLRAVISGIPASVPEDFYDGFLESCIPEEPTAETRILGEFLSRYYFYVSLDYLELRIRHMIDEKKIRVIRDSKIDETKRVFARAKKQ